MPEELRKELSNKYCPRFGQLAVQLGFIAEEQLIDALARQIRDELNGNGHRLLGQILFDTEAMTAAQIDLVLTDLFKSLRREGQDKSGSAVT